MIYDKNIIREAINEILDEEEIDVGADVEDAPPSDSPTANSVPDSNKWDSGVSRGPANPISNEPYSDKVTRGKANQLK